jgi:hypothetical protein
VDFSEARDHFVIIFQIPGSDYKFMDCGLISKKLRGLSANCPKLDFPRIVFLKENPWTESTRDEPGRGAWSTVDRWRRGPKAPERGGALTGVWPPATPVH